MMTRTNKIYALMLVAALLLSIVNDFSIVYAADDGEVFFSEDFETMTDWVSLSNSGWTSPNGAPVTIATEGTNQYVNIITPWGSGLSKSFEPITGLINLEMDIAVSFPSISHFGLLNSGGESLNLLQFYQESNVNKVAYAPTGQALSLVLTDDEWVHVKLLLDTDANKATMWVTRQGQAVETVFSAYDFGGLSGGLGGINFAYPLHWPNHDGNNFKLDNIKVYRWSLKTGLDENFDAYASIYDMGDDWQFENAVNIAIADGVLRLSNDASVKNSHNAYNSDALMLSGEIKYPLAATAEDGISVSVLSGGNVIEIANCLGNKQVNGQFLETLEEGEYFRFDAIISSGDYTLTINSTPVYTGVISDDISAGINGVLIQTSGSALWDIDNLKTQPALSPEQLQELQADLADIDIHVNQGDKTMDLPSSGLNGSGITWASSDKTVMNPDTGAVSNPTWEVGPKEVALTAYVTKYGMTLSKGFTFNFEPAIENLFKNGDFEQLDANGRPEAWFSTASLPLAASDHAQSRNRSALVTGRGDATHSGAQNITLKPNRYYRFSGYVKLRDEVVEGQDGRVSVWMQGGAINSPVGDNTNYVTPFDAFYMNTNDWINIYSNFNTFVTPQRWPATVYVYPFPVGSSTLSFYMDNFELYEYVLRDLSIKGEDSIAVPSSGETVVKLRPEAKNQYGTTVGMENLNYEWTISEDTTGITINNNGELLVSEYAGNQTITLNCKVKAGTVAGSTWIDASKTIAVVNNVSDKPKAYQLSIAGSFQEGSSLTASYHYFQKDNLQEGDSQIKWHMAETFDGVYREISGETSDTLLITPTLAQKFIKFSVTPKTESGIVGDLVYSERITKPRAPIAYDVSVKGNAVVGKTVTGSYKFLDYNGDMEGISQFQWLISDTEEGGYTPISGATAIALPITEAMQDKFIQLQVIPVSQSAPEVGEAYTSAYLRGPAAPAASNVQIIGRARVNEILSVNYIYTDINNDPEQNSIVKWYRSGGDLLRTSATFIPSDADAGTTLYAEVTPVSQNFPYQGAAVRSQSVTIGKNESSSKGLGGGGGTPGTIVLPDNQPITELPVIADKAVAFHDIAGHWAENDIRELAALGVIKGKTEDRFEPEATITRAEFLSIVIRSTRKPAEEYHGEYLDVGQNDWYANVVQTALTHNIITQSAYFNPNAFITREEIAKIAAQTYKLMMNQQWPISYDLSGFYDTNQISDWAVGYLGGCLELGILKGTSNGMLNASAHATRGQAAAIVNRLIHLVY